MARLQPEEIESQLFPIIRRGYDTEKVDAFLSVVAAYYREALRAADDAIPGSTPNARAFEAVGSQIASILATASEAAEEVRAEADRDAQTTRRMAADDAAETMQAAANQLALARQLKAEAQQEAESIRSEVSAEAANLRQDARDRISRYEQDSLARITKLEESAKANVEAFLDEARRRYQELRDAERQSVHHLGSVMSTIRNVREALSADYRTMHIGDLLGFETEAEYDDGTTHEALDEQIDQTDTPFGSVRPRWPDTDPPPSSSRNRKRTVYDTSSREANRVRDGFPPGSGEQRGSGPGDRR